MPRIITFNNRQVIEPGAFAKIESGIPAPPVLGTFGNVLLIDTGSGAGYGFGAGISGELTQGAQNIYEFSSVEDCKKAIGGGILWDLMDYLWSPSRNGNGPAKLFYARAATTIAAKIAMPFSTGAGSVSLAAKTEGTAGNGVLDTTTSNLVRGYAVKLKAGIIDPTKFIMVFYEGRYRGKDANGYEYDTASNTVSNTVITQSVEFSNVNQLLAWMASDYLFQIYFKVTASTASTTSLAASDITTYGGMNLFTGGTTQYNTADIDEVLGNIEDLDNSLILCDDYGITPTLTSQQKLDGANKGALSANNNKILSYIQNTSTYTEKIMFVGGGQNQNEFSRPSTSDGSLQISAYYNSPLVVNVHSGVKVIGQTASGIGNRVLPSLYHAALVCGRVAGLEPQVPVTYKTLRITGLVHELKKSQREQALLAGVLHTRFVPNLGWVVNQGVNTLQQNANLILADGTSPEIQVMRIFHQLNKELIINATPRFVGGNLNTSSAEDVKVFVEGYLASRTATRQVDNLIISSQKITVKLADSNDAWNIRYCIIVNSPINRLFFVGVVLDPNIEV